MMVSFPQTRPFKTDKTFLISEELRYFTMVVLLLLPTLLIPTVLTKIRFLVPMDDVIDSTSMFFYSLWYKAKKIKCHVIIRRMINMMCVLKLSVEFYLTAHGTLNRHNKVIMIPHMKSQRPPLRKLLSECLPDWKESSTQHTLWCHPASNVTTFQQITQSSSSF